MDTNQSLIPSSGRTDFPIEVLPVQLQRLVEEVSISRGVPPVIPAAACFGTVAASLGRGIVIPTFDGQFLYGNLFILITGATGTGKGVGSEPAIQPFRQLQQVLRIRRETAELRNTVWIEEFGADDLALLQPVVTVGSGSKRDHPPTFLTEDTTGAALETVLAENEELTFSFSEEAGLLLDKLNGEVERLFLKGFSVSSFDSIRVTRNWVSLKHPCISLLWLLQPHRLERLLQSRSLIEDGFVGRCLVAHSHAQMAEIAGRKQLGIRLTTQSEYDVLIGQLFASYHRRRNPAPLEVPVSTEARDAMVEFHDQVARKCNGCQSTPARNLMVRSSELAWRVSLVLHAAQFGPEAHKSELDRRTAENAITLVRWFGEQALSMVGPEGTCEPRFQKLLRNLRNSPNQECSEKVLKNSHEFTQEELDDWVTRHSSQIERIPRQNPKGGRPSPAIRLRPPTQQ